MKRDGKYILIVLAVWVLVMVLFALPAHKNPETGQSGKKKTAAVQCENLKGWYDSYNEDYFLGQLPKDTLVQYGDLGPLVSGITLQSSGQFHIIVSLKLNPTPQEAHFTLLHECVHVKLWNKHLLDDHGIEFQTEMVRLAEIGAFKELW